MSNVVELAYDNTTRAFRSLKLYLRDLAPSGIDLELFLAFEAEQIGEYDSRGMSTRDVVLGHRPCCSLPANAQAARGLRIISQMPC